MIHCVAGPYPTAGDLRLRYGANLLTGVTAFSRAFGAPTSLEEDTLNVLAAIHATDLAVKREPGDGFVRDIRVTASTVNRHAFEGIRSDLEYGLWLLSGDNWTVEFRHARGIGEPARDWLKGLGYTLLFSGGVDSFCAAAEYVQQAVPLWLVSHVTHNNVVRGAQEALYTRLRSIVRAPLERTAFYVSGRTQPRWRFPQDKEREDTQRTRSLLFLGLAALVARRTGHDQIIAIAENGQLAINLPLTAARVGPFSTHTAHPEFLSLGERIFSSLLDHEVTVNNPFLYMTKAEVVGNLPAALRAALPDAVSCWRASRVSGFKHCGDCVPCLVRRIALESLGLGTGEYARDLLRENVDTLDPMDNGKRNLFELIEFTNRIRRAVTRGEGAVIEEFPEIVAPGIDRAQAIGLYSRFALEATQVFHAYSNVAALLG